jgi:hypothetical protein
MPVAEDSRSEPSGHSAGEQRRARRASGAAAEKAAKRRKLESPNDIPTNSTSERLPGAFRAGAQGMDARYKTDEGWMPEFRFIEGGSDRVGSLSDRSRERWSTSPLAGQRRSADVLRGSDRDGQAARSSTSSEDHCVSRGVNLW